MTQSSSTRWTPQDVTAVVCTLNSISGIERCLASLRAADVGELIVVDANSSDGTREVAEKFADKVLNDPGIGLGNARNIGITESVKPLILNMGSDNVLPEGQLQRMIDYLVGSKNQGVSAQTIIEGSNFSSKGLNAWRAGRFRPGPAAVIGTPTLFVGDLLRTFPYDPTRRFSDDSELCERWTDEFGASFAISDAYVDEVGKTSWDEVKIRCRMYGVSDHEVFTKGVEAGWDAKRKLRSITHPLRSDFATPLSRLTFKDALVNAPFLAAFTALRYSAWIKKAGERN